MMDGLLTDTQEIMILMVQNGIVYSTFMTTTTLILKLVMNMMNMMNMMKERIRCSYI